MKPTQRQIELIDTVISIVSSWKSTNDIKSPTHYGDITETFKLLIIDEKTTVYQTLCISDIEKSVKLLLGSLNSLETKPLSKEEQLRWVDNLRTSNSARDEGDS